MGVFLYLFLTCYFWEVIGVCIYFLVVFITDTSGIQLPKISGPSLRVPQESINYPQEGVFCVGVKVFDALKPSDYMFVEGGVLPFTGLGNYLNTIYKMGGCTGLFSGSKQSCVSLNRLIVFRHIP